MSERRAESQLLRSEQRSRQTGNGAASTAERNLFPPKKLVQVIWPEKIWVGVFCFFEFCVFCFWNLVWCICCLVWCILNLYLIFGIWYGVFWNLIYLVFGMCNKAGLGAEKKLVSPENLIGDNSKMHFLYLNT